VQVVLDLGALVDNEAESTEDLGDVVHRDDARMERPPTDRPAGRRDVHRFVGKLFGEGRAAQFRPALG
jgi:hypothetical protein